MSSKILNEIEKQLLSEETFRLVFLGDSIVSTDKVQPNWRGIVISVLKDQLGKLMGDWRTPDWGIKGINSGLNGATTKDLVNHLETEVFFYKPNMIICMVGKNDPFFNISPSQHKKNVEKLINRISNKFPSFVFCSSPPDNNKKTISEFKEYVVQIKPLFSHSKAQFVNLFKIYQGFNLDKFFTFISEFGNEVIGIKPGELDFQHPNSLGHAYIAKVILKEVFGIKFNPEMHMKTLLAGEKYPKY